MDTVLPPKKSPDSEKEAPSVPAEWRDVFSPSALLGMISKSEVTGAQAAGAGISVSVAGVGATIIRAALADPEPVTKILLTIIGGGMVVFGGGNASHILTGSKPRLKTDKSGIDFGFSE